MRPIEFNFHQIPLNTRPLGAVQVALGAAQQVDIPPMIYAQFFRFEAPESSSPRQTNRLGNANKTCERDSCGLSVWHLSVSGELEIRSG